MNKDNISLIISGYAAVVSTTLMGLGIINYLKSNKVKIKVKMSYENKFSLSGFEGFYLRVTITNQSEKEYIIKSINICLGEELNTEFGKGKEFYLPNSEISFPITLRRGEEKIINLCSLNSLYDKVLNKTTKNTKITIVAVDTMGKKHYSKKIKSNDLKKIIEENCIDKIEKMYKKCFKKGLVGEKKNVFIKYDYSF
ncbi:hypothetical protein [Clostridium estertheticum]|uniref:hypothetical protein n=1 Tax=Clostridium estertheticum TaxID=238834 RepID=UPI001C0C5F02|nr:hypothetical protein [Clostridium estertheticum]MBU3073875.1 hypothetical protein [Clostridium estertheticum]MBU3163970.1 hypothetical protein [Clostridium estertheticum]